MAVNDQILWTERYRPRKVEDCILPESIKASFQQYVNAKEIPNLLLTGTAGVGKTTIAKALCNEVGCDFLVMNGSDENSVDDVRVKIKNYASSVSLMGGRKVIIIDEADYLSTNAQAALRGAIEEFAVNCSFIFTCNFKNKLLDAIHSRCSVIDFRIQASQKQQMAIQFFKRVEWILQQENITYDKPVVAAIITKYLPDNRRILNELQRYSASGTIDKGILTQVADVEIDKLIGLIKTKDFANARKWVAQADIDASTVFRGIYDCMYDKIHANSIPQAVLVLAKYQYQAAFSADAEINLMACLVELMMDCAFL